MESLFHAKSLKEAIRHLSSASGKKLKTIASESGLGTPSSLSQKIASKRFLAKDDLNIILKILKTSSKEIEFIHKLYELETARIANDEDSETRILEEIILIKNSCMVTESNNVDKYFGHFLLPAVREATKYLRSISSLNVEKSIAQKLHSLGKNRFAKEEIESAFQRCIALSDIEKQNSVTTSSEVSNTNFRLFYKQWFNWLSVNFFKVPKEERHARTLTISVPKDKLALIKADLDLFYTQLQTKYIGNGPDDVVLQFIAVVAPIFTEEPDGSKK